MSLFGTKANAKPVFLATEATPKGNSDSRYANTYMATDGWTQELRTADGRVRTEILVAVNNGVSKSGAPNVASFYFVGGPSTPIDANTTGNVVIAFSQKVGILGPNIPNVTLTQTGATSTSLLARYIAGNNTPKLTFQYTTVADYNGNVAGNSVLTLTDQTISLGGGSATFINANTLATISANLVLPNVATFQYPYTGVVVAKNVVHALAQVNSASFGAASQTRSAASKVFIRFTGPVNLYGVALPNVWLASDNTTSGNVLATMTAGNASANLTFSFTNPTGFANLNVQPLLAFVNGTLNDVAANTRVNSFITTAVSTATGTISINA